MHSPTRIDLPAVFAISFLQLSELNFKIEERYNLLKNDYDKLESDFLKLREENKEDRAENSKLRDLIEKLSSDLQNSKHTRGNQAKDSYNFEDIEALKQQVTLACLLQITW